MTWRTPDLRLLTGVLSGQALTAGCINVLVVVTALGLLELGEGGVGLLDAAVGLGALLGALVIVPLVGRARLTAPLLVGALLWGLPLVAIAAWPNVGVAIIALALVGIGNTLVDVAGFTLLQRIAPDDVLARVFGVVETVFYLAIGVGSLLAPLLVETAGTRWALVRRRAVPAGGRRSPSAGGSSGIDADAVVPLHELELLGMLPMFAPLPELALERLARQLIPVAGRRGDGGHRAGRRRRSVLRDRRGRCRRGRRRPTRGDRSDAAKASARSRCSAIMPRMATVIAQHTGEALCARA